MRAVAFAVLVGLCGVFAAAADELAGNWVVEEILGRGVVDDPRSTLVLGDGLAVNGSGGCNRFAGRRTGEGGTLLFGPLAATRMMCPPAIMEQESRYFAALALVRGHRFENGRLVLVAADGQPVLRLAKVGLTRRGGLHATALPGWHQALAQDDLNWKHRVLPGSSPTRCPGKTPFPQ